MGFASGHAGRGVRAHRPACHRAARCERATISGIGPEAEANLLSDQPALQQLHVRRRPRPAAVLGLPGTVRQQKARGA